MDRRARIAVRRVARPLRLHIARYRRLGPLPFAIRAALEGLLVSLLVGILVAPFLGERENLRGIEPHLLVLFAVLWAPIGETFFLQAVPIHVLRLGRAPAWRQVLWSTLLFAGMHIGEGWSTALSAGLVGGLYFAAGYVWWARRSAWTAFWTTALAHGIRNAIAVGVYLLSRNA